MLLADPERRSEGHSHLTPAPRRRAQFLLCTFLGARRRKAAEDDDELRWACPDRRSRAGFASAGLLRSRSGVGIT